MKRILTLVVILLAMSACTQRDDTVQTQRAIEQLNEQVVELIGKTEELQLLVESQAGDLRDLEDRIAILGMAASEPVQSQVASSDPVDTLDSIDDEGVVSYQQNEEVELEGLMISSPSGRMVSDVEKEIFGGDLKISSSRGTIRANGAIVEMRGDRLVITSKSVLKMKSSAVAEHKKNQAAEAPAAEGAVASP